MTDKKTDLQTFWGDQITAGLKREQNFREVGQNVVDRYRGEETGSNASKHSFNILWSNTEILKSATFSRVPPPNVTRLYKDDNQLALNTAVVEEAVLKFYSDQPEFRKVISNGRDDMLLPGRGTAWVSYDAEFNRTELEAEEFLVDGVAKRKFTLEGVDREPDGFDENEVAFIEDIEIQDIKVENVYWKDFLQSNSRTWEKTWWVARRRSFDKDELINSFGKDVTRKLDAVTIEEGPEDEKRDVYPVWEIWNKNKRERIWYTDRANDIIHVEEAPLSLRGFFPCPRPMMSYTTTSTMVPRAEFTVYQTQAYSLDDIECRLESLTNSLKAVGWYSGKNSTAISLVSDAKDGQLVPVDMAALSGEGPLNQQIVWWPIGEIAAVIQQLEARKVILKGEIFELTGISDIMRGDTDPGETASAQKIKGSYGSTRLRPRREPVEYFIRDLYTIMAEIVADKFEPFTIARMTGLQPDDSTMAFMRETGMEGFRIDVETDSTVNPNEEIEQRKALQFVETMGALFSQAIPAAENAPQLIPLLGSTLKFVAQQFKVGRKLEEEITATIDMISQTPPSQQEGPTPEQQIEMLKLQNENQQLIVDNKRLDVELQLKQADLIMANQNNETDVQQDLIRSEAQVSTALIESDASERDNETKLAVEGLKTLQSAATIQ